LEARSDDDRLGGRNDTPHASARGCCRSFLIKPRANPDFSAQVLERVQTILARRDRLPHPWRVRAQEPVRRAYKKGIRYRNHVPALDFRRFGTGQATKPAAQTACHVFKKQRVAKFGPVP
jgi:hypothetical protein